MSAPSYPWDDPRFSKIHKFFEALRAGRFITTRCSSCGAYQWPPRGGCSSCLGEEVEWVEVPKEGRLQAYALSYVTEASGPLLVGSIELSNGMRLLSRIEGSSYEDLKVGMKMRLKECGLKEGRPYWVFSPVKD